MFRFGRSVVKGVLERPIAVVTVHGALGKTVLRWADGAGTADFAAGLDKVLVKCPARFLAALSDAVKGEVYDAADGLFRWISVGDDGYRVGCNVFSGAERVLKLGIGAPAFTVRRGAETGDAASRGEAVASMLLAYKGLSDREEARWRVIEPAALALARYFGSIGDYARARAEVAHGLGFGIRSLHLKAADHALALKLAGKSVPERLEKFVGEDNGYLKRWVCPEPFKRFDIGPDGNVLVCCGHWLPTPIGNLQDDAVDDILNSETAQKIRRSMTDGTYKYCNHLECSGMIQGYLPERDTTDDPVLRRAIDKEVYRLDKVEQVMFAYDQTCNLSCPSCRTQKIVEKFSQSEAKTRTVEEKLKPLLPGVKVLYINPAGELFASRASRKVLEMIGPETCPDLKLDIISNGMLFNETEWNRYPNIHGMIRSIRVSTDAATKETFETLRRGGIFEVFVRNMEFLGRLRADGTIPQLKMSFTYQLGNFREMAEFVRFGKRFNCDFVIFERLQNLGTFSPEEFRERAVHLSDHPLHGEFREIIADPVFADLSVWSDFEWEGAAKVTEEQARDRLSRLQREAAAS